MILEMITIYSQIFLAFARSRLKISKNNISIEKLGTMGRKNVLYSSMSGPIHIFNFKILHKYDIEN